MDPEHHMMSAAYSSNGNIGVHHIDDNRTQYEVYDDPYGNGSSYISPATGIQTLSEYIPGQDYDIPQGRLYKTQSSYLAPNVAHTHRSNEIPSYQEYPRYQYEESSVVHPSYSSDIIQDYEYAPQTTHDKQTHVYSRYVPSSNLTSRQQHLPQQTRLHSTIPPKSHDPYSEREYVPTTQTQYNPPSRPRYRY